MPSSFEHVSLIAHADWSKNPSKRWMAFAVSQANDHWLIRALIKAGPPSALFSYLKSQVTQPGCILAGFDFPIGVPFAYASKAGIEDFLTALPLFGDDDWSEFYTPADEPAQISLRRPFYPSKPGNTRRFHLEHGLGIPFGQLYRLCEVAHENRRAASPLFWTLGSQQVGKAAISAWQSLLAPSITNPDLNLKIWPFSGPLSGLCLPGNIIVVETYPAEFYSHIGLSFSSPVRRSKRRQEHRLAFASQLVSWAHEHHVDLPTALLAKIQSGFGSAQDGEDQFDALVGLYGMINVILGNQTVGEPVSPILSKIEGWIFGQERP